MKTHHPVAEFPFGDAASDSYNRASQFVAKNLRRRHVRVINLLDVGPANPASRNFDEHFAVANFGDRDFFNADNSLFAVNTRAHGFGDGPQRTYGLQSCAGAAHVAETSATSFENQ